MLQIARRNIKVFFRDRSSVFFSLMAVFIIIGLYAVFLGDNLKKGFEGLPGVDFLLNSWVMAGILSVTAVTTTMGAFGIMVEDRTRKISKDFFSSPLKRSSLAAGYILSSVVIGILMSLLTFVVAEVYIVLTGGTILPFLDILKVLGLILLSVFAGSAMIFFLVTLFKSQNAFATASTVIGTLIGFITGIYMPVGVLPEAVQWIVKCFPISHAALLLRQVLTAAPMEATFAGAPAEMARGYAEELGTIFLFGDTECTVWASIAVLVGTTILFYLLSIVSMRRKGK